MSQAVTIVRLKGPIVSNFLIYDADSTVLVDGGMIGGVKRLESALENIGRRVEDLDLILLTHGHFDHALHIHSIRMRSGAKVAAHPAEQVHVNGKWPYRGPSRVAGTAERIGRFLCRYKAFELDRHLTDGEYIDLCGGIRAIHLPGHTTGHLGFFVETNRILLTGDLFSHWDRRKSQAPAIFSTCPALYPASFAKVIALNPVGIQCNHGNDDSPKTMYNTLKEWAKEHVPGI
ncbi:MAG TPA: MBL fold metallo-hydrolase [Bacteroidetes bacterium]|nr:MBL fold metallo-hydrolase [Bacteroidota bacterium]